MKSAEYATSAFASASGLPVSSVSRAASRSESASIASYADRRIWARSHGGVDAQLRCACHAAAQGTLPVGGGWHRPPRRRSRRWPDPPLPSRPSGSPATTRRQSAAASAHRQPLPCLRISVRASRRRVAPVNRQRDAGDVRGLGRGKKQHRRGDVGRRADALLGIAASMLRRTPCRVALLGHPLRRTAAFRSSRGQPRLPGRHAVPTRSRPLASEPRGLPSRSRRYPSSERPRMQAAS